MNERIRSRRAKVMLDVAEYRLSYWSDEERSDPLTHLEHVIQMKPNIRLAYRDEILEGGLGIEARVKFFKGGHQLIEVTERAAREAMCGLPMARFAVAHEIGHVMLHRRRMRTKIEGAARNFTRDQSVERSRLHHETQGMEDEADLYAGLFLVPLSKIDMNADFMKLARKYNAPPGRVRQLRWDVMEVWSTLMRLKRDR